MMFSSVFSHTLLCLFFLQHHFSLNLANIVLASYSRWDSSPPMARCDYVSTSTTPKLLKLVVAFGINNTIATVVIFLITLLNIFVYKLRQLHEETFGQDIDSPSLDKHCQRFSITEVQLATNNFDDGLVIGRGGFGKVYKAVLSNGTNNSVVAMKRLNAKSRQGAREFWNEIDMLSKFRHSHLVSLIGYCNDFNEMILVYEYMPHGTLADHLYKLRRNAGTTSIISEPLSWEQRLKICIGAARGLDYLHTGTGVQHRVIHRDVKSSNILLDEKFIAKVSDFGLSKTGPANHSSSHISTHVKGTIGYLDPEYILTRRLTRKSDVFSFGVVLFEVLCGRPAVDQGLDRNEQALAVWVQTCIGEGSLDEIIDISLRNQISRDSYRAFVKIAHRCLHSHSNERPTMAEVVAKLEFSLELQQRTASSKDFLAQSSEIINTPDGSEELVDVDNASNKNCLINEIVTISDASNSSGRSGVAVAYRKKRKGKLLQTIGIMTKGSNIPKKDPTSNRTGPSLGWRWKSFWRKKISSSQMEPLPVLSSQMEPLPFLDPRLPIRAFSVAEIKVATKCFQVNQKVASTRHSDVFRGYIDGPKEVCIKRFTRVCDYKVFCARMIVLSKASHENLVSLCGYCYHKDEICLVYEYISNGSLHDHLYSNRLPWKRRLQICIGVAKGLNYLHTGVAGSILAHRDLKPTSILLDGNWLPKISGLQPCNCSVYSSDENVTNDAYWYTDLEDLMTGESDVYSIGMVLLVVLLSLEGPILQTTIVDAIENSNLHQIINPQLVEKIAPECLIEFVDIALSCVCYSGIGRPTMGEVVKRIEFALELQEKAEAFTHHFDGSRIFELDGNIYPELLHSLKKWCHVHIYDSVPNFDFDSMDIAR